jgi:hypothetical protein
MGIITIRRIVSGGFSQGVDPHDLDGTRQALAEARVELRAKIPDHGPGSGIREARSRRESVSYWRQTVSAGRQSAQAGDATAAAGSRGGSRSSTRGAG